MSFCNTRLCLCQCQRCRTQRKWTQNVKIILIGPLQHPCRGNSVLLVKNEIETSVGRQGFIFFAKKRSINKRVVSKWRKTLSMGKHEHLYLRERPTSGVCLTSFVCCGVGLLPMVCFHTLFAGISTDPLKCEIKRSRQHDLKYTRVWMGVSGNRNAKELNLQLHLKVWYLDETVGGLVSYKEVEITITPFK